MEYEDVQGIAQIHHCTITLERLGHLGHRTQHARRTHRCQETAERQHDGNQLLPPFGILFVDLVVVVAVGGVGLVEGDGGHVMVGGVREGVMKAVGWEFGAVIGKGGVDGEKVFLWRVWSLALRALGFGGGGGRAHGGASVGTWNSMKIINSINVIDNWKDNSLKNGNNRKEDEKRKVAVQEEQQEVRKFTQNAMVTQTFLPN